MGIRHAAGNSAGLEGQFHFIPEVQDVYVEVSKRYGCKVSSITGDSVYFTPIYLMGLFEFIWVCHGYGCK